MLKCIQKTINYLTKNEQNHTIVKMII